MGPAARDSRSDVLTPKSSPPVDTGAFGTDVDIGFEDTIEILWLDDENQQTLRIVTDADQTLKLHEHRVDVESALADLTKDADRHHGAQENGCSKSEAHPLTAGQTNKLLEPVYGDELTTPRPQPRPSVPRHDAVVSKTSLRVVVTVTLLGALLGVGLTVLVFVFSPDAWRLLSPVQRAPDAEQPMPAASATVYPPSVDETASDDRATAEVNSRPALLENTASMRTSSTAAREPRGESSFTTIPDELVLPITFESGQHRVASRDMDALRALAKAMIAAPRTRFDVVGYSLPSEADDRSEARALAERRARVALDVIRALGPSKRRMSARAARYQEPLLVDQPAGEPHEAIILRVTRR